MFVGVSEASQRPQPLTFYIQFLFIYFGWVVKPQPNK